MEGRLNGTDGYNEKRNALSGNFGLVYSPFVNQYFSFNVGRAFRMPITEELFTEVVSCKGIKKGNPNLEPEYSWNFDIGYRGFSDDCKFDWDFALFYNIIDGYIQDVPDLENEVIDFTYKNTDALIFGGEISLSYKFEEVIKSENDLYLGLAASYVYGIDKSSENSDEPLFGIPPLNLLADLKYYGKLNEFWINGYFINLQAEFAAEQNRIPAIPDGAESGPWGYLTSDSHFAFNLVFGINSNSLTGSPKLRFVVKNLFDNDYKPYGSYIPAMGRNFKLLLSFSF